MSDVTLEKIESGEATATEARGVISEFLKEGSERSLERIYATLGAWLWNSLESRRRDAELREWFDILRRVSASLAPKNAAYAERFRAFYDLLQMSINTAKVARPSEVMHRQHVVEILQLLRDAPSRQLEKAAIAKKLDLKDANLSRILRLMTNARFVERTTSGKFAHFALTRDGLIALEKHERPGAGSADRLAKLMDKKLRLKTRPALTAEEHVVLRTLFDVPLPSSTHVTSHAAGLLVRDPLGVRQVMEDYLLQLHSPGPTAPGYMKARTKSSYHGSSVTIVQVKKDEGHGASTSIGAVSSPKPASFPAGMLHLAAGEDPEHVE
ncbi:winged helix DNA-binding protein [Bradyrhizobium sp. DOA9]|uniref:winged helix DNA-binding protein n=1 Tax=Bradyrhizobium sp. DOA9 TaxID=1126627 RepID=UPI00046892AE|nr:winged helix DNA-binding protein [Bradyrhizobium sp. DOA9]GAJ37861.1 hypothetical protein BDOA9_0204790 [Bradyrhizobium sp. DOA9]